jgi:hypothetical protein
MRYDIIIKTNGEVVTVMVDREGQECSNLVKVTEGFGKKISDERIGPECDRVDEVEGV